MSQKDLCRYVALVMLYADEKNLSQTKTALHRTRLRFLDRYNFSVFFFYKTERQTAPWLAASQKTRTEKNERNFGIFQWKGSFKDRLFFSINWKIVLFLFLDAVGEQNTRMQSARKNNENPGLMRFYKRKVQVGVLKKSKSRHFHDFQLPVV